VASRILLSSPDEVIRLKTRVTVYEEELNKELTELKNLGNPDVSSIDPKLDPSFVGGFAINILLRIVDVNQKLLEAYREYTALLERIAPR
jgi:hypothetical protein